MYQAAGPVIIEDHKVLLNREKSKSEHDTEDMFMFPGGKLEPGETPEIACKREVKEELGIDIEIIRPLRTIMAEKYSSGDPIELHHFLATRVGEITPSPETLEWGWYDINNLPESCSDNVRQIITDLLSEKEI